MTLLLERTAVLLLASGLSRRYGRRDKMLVDLGGKPLVEHAAGAIAQLNPLTRVVVSPADRPAIAERLIGRFVVAVNKKPKMGLGHSIAVGAQVALQFKPDAILVCMADMPFVEAWLLEALVAQLGQGQADIVHAGSSERPHPPTAFGPACFKALAHLDGDDGAKHLLWNPEFRVSAFNAPAPLLLDVDTREQLDLARKQLEIRNRHEQLRAAKRAMSRGTPDHVTDPPTVEPPRRLAASA